jgi:hypothetical protein
LNDAEACHTTLPITALTAPSLRAVCPFEKAHEAYEYLAKGAFGKVVIKIAE